MIDCNLGGTIAPSNGTVDCTKKNSPGSLCTYRCQDGYSLDGPAKTTCMNAGTWSPNNFPRCIIDECRLDLPDPENGIVTCSQAKEYKSVCRFYCDQGYSLGLDPIYNQVLCDLQSGKLEWTFMHEDVPLENKIITTVDQLPSCPRSQCPELKLLNGQTQCTDENYYKSECRFVCNEGFVLDGTTSTTCRGVAKPDWDTKKPACKPKIS